MNTGPASYLRLSMDSQVASGLKHDSAQPLNGLLSQKQEHGLPWRKAVPEVFEVLKLSCTY
jgi:hypothetical protein